MNENNVVVVEETESYFGKPEFYDYKDVELGEGFQYDEKLLGEFNSIAAKYNLSQKGANELMNMAVRLTKQTQDNLAAAYVAATRDKISSYKEMLQSDGEIGGKNLDVSLRTANIAYEKFADDELKSIFSETGLNYHPKVIKMFLSIGKQMQNDAIYPSNTPQVQKEAREDILFPSMQQL